MSKKSRPKPKTKKKPELKFPKKKTAGSRKAVWKGAAVRRKGPRSQVLPGMQQVRDQKLDELCEAVGENLTSINQASAAKQDNLLAALKRLQARGLPGYLHAGVRLTRVPGSDKVSVRLVKQETAEETVPEILDAIDDARDAMAQSLEESEELPAE
jgi:hypothetical protein